MSENENNATVEAQAVETFDAAEVTANKLSGILSYIWILFLVPLLQKTHEKSEYVKFHVNQGLLLFIVEIVGNVAASILSFIFAAVHLALIGSLIVGLWNIATIVLIVLGVLNAVKGEKKKLPVIGGLFTILK